MGEREANLREAIQRLEALGDVKAVSALYETEPVEVEREQSWFLNCAVRMETELMAEEFLRQMLAVEQAMGEDALSRKGRGPLILI